ncbi:hypothetical protein GH714_001868 [Hevea brasiliensis]|uniref:Uncharacterized protein n=1 Tax=Hevea brasiliensis TaxID=3981 RepID=A0A6A6LY79_HEVBR|nr:hypothetical protein GH714_001868 [Hevea brasiliensis]
MYNSTKQQLEEQETEVNQLLKRLVLDLGKEYITATLLDEPPLLKSYDIFLQLPQTNGNATNNDNNRRIRRSINLPASPATLETMYNSTKQQLEEQETEVNQLLKRLVLDLGKEYITATLLDEPPLLKSYDIFLQLPQTNGNATNNDNNRRIRRSINLPASPATLETMYNSTKQQLEELETEVNQLLKRLVLDLGKEYITATLLDEPPLLKSYDIFLQLPQTNGNATNNDNNVIVISDTSASAQSLPVLSHYLMLNEECVKLASCVKLWKGFVF